MTLVFLVSISATNTSVNPAGVTGGSPPRAFGQLWLFWLAPTIGAVIADLPSRWLHEPQPVEEAARPQASPAGGG